jgi:hypothetical protein
VDGRRVADSRRRIRHQTHERAQAATGEDHHHHRAEEGARRAVADEGGNNLPRRHHVAEAPFKGEGGLDGDHPRLEEEDQCRAQMVPLIAREEEERAEENRPG